MFSSVHVLSIILLISVGALNIDSRASGEESSTSISRRLLIDGAIIDSETGDAVRTFRVLPGVRYNRGRAGRESVTVWQPHMIREMQNGKFEWPRTRGFDEMRFRIEADGYRPATTTWLGKGGPHLRMKVHMRPDAGITGVVFAPNGQPAVNATLAVGLPNRGVRLDGCQVVGWDSKPGRLSDQWRLPSCVQTDPEGRFVLPYETDAAAILCVVHESGYFEMMFTDFVDKFSDQLNDVEIRLEPWASVKGQVYWKTSPGAGALISATVRRSEPYPDLISFSVTRVASDDGEFHFEYLPPGNVGLSHHFRRSSLDLTSVNVLKVKSDPVQIIDKAPDLRDYQYPIHNTKLEAGESETVIFGGKGKTVVGKLVGLDSYDDVSIEIRPPAPDVWNQRRLRGANFLRSGYDVFRKSNYGSLYFRDKIAVAADGTFKIPDVMTGQYNLWVRGAVGAIQFNVQYPDADLHDLGAIQVKPIAK